MSAPRGLNKREVCRRYEAGEGIVAIARDLDVSHVAIHKIVRNGGCAKHQRNFIGLAKVRQICAARGVLPAHIVASQHGMSSSGVYKVWHRHGGARA